MRILLFWPVQKAMMIICQIASGGKQAGNPWSYRRRFKFKNGEMVPNSNIGIRNAGLIMVQFGKCALSGLYRCFLDPIMIVYFFKIILAGSTDSYIINIQTAIYIVVDLLVLLTIKMLQLVFMYYQTISFPNNWIGGSIKKMKKVKEDSYKWKDTQLTQIKVGDIVRLRYEQISPFDILILDTSELRYNDKIININEGRIRGDNRLLVKKAIRNLDLRLQGESSSNPEYLSGLAKKLNGYVEYDPPSGTAENFYGSFKLKNDPKVAAFTEEHLILCGAKVHSKEAIGMVLFTGSNTRIFQKSSVETLGTNLVVPKIPITYLHAHKIAVLFTILTFLVSLAVLILGSADEQSRALQQTVESYVIGFSMVKKFLAIWASLLNVIPGALLGIPDVYCLAIAIYLRFKGVPKEMFSEFYKDGQSITNSMKLGQKGRIRDVRKAKLSTIGRAAASIDQESSKQIELFSLRRASTPFASSPNLGRSDTNKSDINDPKSQLAKGANAKAEKNELNDNNYLRVINCTVLPDLGYIDQVFFDKTDTLTSGEMKVAELSTFQKCYEIPSKDFGAMIAECISQPDLYAYEDENAANKESGEYSEKSQEYMDEMNGYFNPQVIPEDFSDEGFIDTGLYPNYTRILRDTKGGQELLKQEKERGLLGHGSFYNRKNIFQSFYKRQKPKEELGTNNSVQLIETSFYRSLGSQTPLQKESSLERTEEFRQLNALKKKFKQAFKLDESLEGLIRKKAALVIHEEGDTQNLDIDSVEEFDEMYNEVDLEYKIGFKVEKKLSPKNFIFDLHSKKDHLSELLNLLQIMLECSSTEMKSHNSMGHEERAIANLLQKLGYTISSNNRDERKGTRGFLNLDNSTTYTISNRLHSVQQYDVVCVNAYTKKRDRMSIIMRDPSNLEQYTLIVKGTGPSFRERFTPLQMGEKELNGYKALLTDYRLQGLGRIILGAKKITRPELLEYLQIYNTISDSSREQLTTFEAHADRLEDDLSFIGCIGTKNIVREEAIGLVDKMKIANLQINVLSGDGFDNCINVAKELRLTKANFSDTSSFFHVNFRNEKQGQMDMQRMLDALYEKLMDDHLQMMEGIAEKEKNEDQSRYDFLKTKLNLSKNQDMRVSPEIRYTALPLKSHMKQTLLINGRSTNILVSCPILRCYLKTVLLFTDTVIGYEMLPSQKAVIVNLFKSLGKRCLAIGDGLNDQAMFASANVSIQLATLNTPIALADIVVRDLKSINYLLFSLGPQIYKNIMTFNLISIWNNMILNSVQMINMVYMMLGSSIITLTEYTSYNMFQIASACIFCFFSQTYTTSFIYRFPAIYKERLVLTCHYSRVIILLLAYIIIEACGIYYTISYLLGYLVKSNGYSYTWKECNIWFAGIIGISSICKYYFAIQRPKLVNHLIFTGLVILYISVLLLRSVNDSYLPMQRVYLLNIVSNSMFYFSFVQLLGVIVFMDYVIINIITKKFVAPVWKLIRQVVQTKQVESFRLNSSTMIAELISSRIDDSQEEDIITSVRNCFDRKCMNDPWLKKIQSIDYFNFSLPINRANQIKDMGERRKFMKYRPPDETKYWRIYLGFTALSSAVDWLVLVCYFDYRETYFLDTGALYAVLGCLLMLCLSYSNLSCRIQERISSITKATVLISNMLGNILNQVASFKVGLLPFVRFMTGPLANDFFVMATMIVLHDLVAISSTLWTKGIASRMVESSFISARRLVGQFGAIIFRIMMMARYDILSKMDFVSQERLLTEMNNSNEKLVLLMPKFVLDRINYLEMSNNFVADDAGDVCVLFCDICEFDEVLKELQDSVVSLLDDVFRKFDGFCKRWGVQKIETVGKTYMACGGLKFIESTLNNELKQYSPAERTVKLSMEMLAFIEDYTYKAGKRLHIKIGVHYGSCIFGVLGYHKPQFSLIGDTINTTSRHCTTGDKGRIVLSESCYQEIKGRGVCKTKKLKVAMKGKGDDIAIYVIRRRNVLHTRRANQNRELSVIEESQSASRRMSVQGNYGKAFMRNSQRVPSLLGDDKSFIDDSESKASEQPEKDGIRSFGNLNDIEFFEQPSLQSWNSQNKEIEEELSIENKPVDIAQPKRSEEDVVKSDREKQDIPNKVKPTIFYEEKLFRNYNRYCNIGLAFTAFDVSSAEIIYWTDPKILNKNAAFRICYLAIVLVYVIFMIVKQLRRNPVAFKFYLMLVIVSRHFLSCVEYLFTNYQYPGSSVQYYQLTYLATNQLYGSACDMLFICASGIFLWKQILYLEIYICVLHLVCMSLHTPPTHQYFMFIILNGLAYNLLSSWRICHKQLESFFRIVASKKKSVYLSKFVDRLLPKHIQEVNRTNNMLAESFDDVTILFADIVGFTKYSAGKEPRQVIEMLSKLFTEFDKECNRLNLYKVYTIGDCYVVLGFIDKRNRKPPSEEASDVIQMGISMIQSINKVRKQVNFMELNMRIGIHTGKIFGGIVGTDIVRFDIYGPDVLIANKMESGGMPGKICISKKTKDLIETLETTSYTFSENKPIHIKSLGIAYESYFVGSKLLRDEESKDDSMILDDRDNLTQVN